MSKKVIQVAVSPDGMKVAAVLGDGSVTLFPLDSPQPDPPQPRVDDKAFEGLWADLAGEDGERAYVALRTLSQSPEDVASRLAKRLHPSRSLSRMIADLDSDDFDCREAATKELAAVDCQAEPALRKALEDNPSAEARSRIERLLPSLDKWVVTDPDLFAPPRRTGCCSGSARPSAGGPRRPRRGRTRRPARPRRPRPPSTSSTNAPPPSRDMGADPPSPKPKCPSRRPTAIS